MEERLANLEALICRLDTELNQQMERSLISTRMFATPTSAGTSSKPTSLLNLATALEGRYQVLSELGRGGMGIVYQAYDKQLKEQVAIKLLSPLLSTDEDALERLTREVSLARRVTHPNVIRIHDIAEVNGLHYVSMEYFGAPNLKEHLKRSGSLSLLNAYQILSQICDGLEAAHSQGVVHRDLKAQNILIGRSGQIKIIDFGLARAVHLEGMTATGLIMGTPEYMAPEQVAGKHVDERADIYALGVILFEMLTGRVPFRGDSAIAVGFQQLKDPPPSPRSINPQIPEEVERIILKALEKNPIQRYRTVHEMRKEFESALPRFATTASASPTSEGTLSHEKD
jgi:serine/threonine protein kinase